MIKFIQSDYDHNLRKCTLCGSHLKDEKKHIRLHEISKDIKLKQNMIKKLENEIENLDYERRTL